MPHWGDETHDWEGLGDAINIIDRIFRFWRLPVAQVKEKWGSVRIYMHGLGYSDMYRIIHPCYWHGTRCPKWFWKLNIYVFTSYGDKWYNHLWRLLIHKPTAKIHEIIYKHGYKKAVMKHPNLAESILSSADYRELLIGIVKEEDCKHEQKWVGSEDAKCGVCGKIFKNYRAEQRKANSDTIK